MKADLQRAEDLPHPIDMLRALMAQQGFDAYVVPRFDAHQSEYCAPHDERLRYVTGFSGSAGVAVITGERAVIFVDGRYQVQVRQEIDPTLVEVSHFFDAPLDAWLRENIGPGQRVGFNAMLLPPSWDTRLGDAVSAAGGKWEPCEADLVDLVWPDQPEPPVGRIEAFGPDRAGAASADKRERLVRRLHEAQADLLLETQPDNIAWLLNVRGRDVVFNPTPHSFLVFDRKGEVDWLVDSRKLPNDLADFELDKTRLSDPSRLFELLADRAAGRKVLVDPDFTSAAAARAIRQAGGEVKHERSPVTLMKMVKNSHELEGFRAAHMADGVAWVRFLSWLGDNGQKREQAGDPVTEMEAAERIAAFRALDSDFVEPSFATIAAAGANAAMCHYHPGAGKNAAIRSGETFLLDSGGQYFSGTTDATRTTGWGDIAQEIRTSYTAVLKGFISMLSLRFPHGTKGHQIDAIARRPLWDLGLDYDHGTGHGVGHFLSVHEQPQRFDKKVNEIAITQGMVTTIEPGHYVGGRFGIRIENQVEVVANEDGFLSFASLTMVPVDRHMVDRNALAAHEILWLDNYHRQVWEALSPRLEGRERDWLSQATSPLGKG